MAKYLSESFKFQVSLNGQINFGLTEVDRNDLSETLQT